MLRIADYAKRSGIEWYEVLRNVVSNEAPSPVVIPTQGEIAVLRTDENHDIEAYPGAEHINLAYEECELNPVSIARIIHAKFPVIFRSYVTVIPGSGQDIANNVFDFDDIPLRPKLFINIRVKIRLFFLSEKKYVFRWTTYGCPLRPSQLSPSNHLMKVIRRENQENN